MDWKIILSGLIGSIATILLTKIILIQIFDRKINAGEIAVAQWTILRTSMNTLSTFMDKALEMSSELGQQVSQELYSNSSFSAESPAGDSVGT